MSGRKVEICIAEQVEREFRKNVETVQDEAERKLNTLKRTIEKLDDLAALHGSPGKADLRHWNGHVGRSRSFAELWIQASSIVQQSDAVATRAFHRAMAHKTPARGGSTSSVQDCLVLETCLEHMHRLRSDGRMASAVFVSSNTRDYAAEDRTRIKHDVEQEFRSLNLLYAPNMGAARGLLGI